MRNIITSAIAVFCLNGPLAAQQVFQEKPENFNPQTEVSACFIRVGEDVLFLKRAENKPQGTTWGIPGGKKNKGETSDEAVIREIREETGIKISENLLSYHGKVYVRYPDMDYVFHMYEYQIENFPEVKFNPEEHEDFRWVALPDALEQLTLIPGEEECISLAYGIQNSDQIS